MEIAGEKITAFYQQNGYWDVVVSEARIDRDQISQRAEIVFNIKEGSLHLFDGLVQRGDTADELKGLLNFSRYEPISRASIVEFNESARRTLYEQGYLYSKTSVSIKKRPYRSNFAISVIITTKKNKRVRIGNISMAGLTKTKSKVVERELRFRSGDWYLPRAISETRSALLNLRIFKSVKIEHAQTLDQGKQLEEIDLVLSFKEGNTGIVNFGPGFSILKGLRYVADTTFYNITGWGRQLSLSAGISEEANQRAIGDKTLLGRKASVSYIEPYILDLPVDLHFLTSYRTEADDFWRTTWNGEVAAIHNLKLLGPFSRISGFYSQIFHRDEGSEEQRANLVTTGFSRIGRVGMRLALDFRSDPSWPTSGFYHGSEIAWARPFLGGNYHFLQWSITENVYFPLSDYFVGALSLTLSAFEDIRQDGNEDTYDILPASERYKAGGPNQVRGFSQPLGPFIAYRDLDDDGNETGDLRKQSLGGTKRAIAKAEIRHKISDKTGVTGFVDAGNTFFTKENEENFNRSVARKSSSLGTVPTTMRDNQAYNFESILLDPGLFASKNFFSYGASFNYLSPIGSLNVSYALPMREPASPSCQDDDVCFTRSRTGDLHWFFRGKLELSIGSTF